MGLEDDKRVIVSRVQNCPANVESLYLEMRELYLESCKQYFKQSAKVDIPNIIFKALGICAANMEYNELCELQAEINHIYKTNAKLTRGIL